MMNIQCLSLMICKNQLSNKSFCFVHLLVVSQSDRYLEVLILNIPGEVERENYVF